MNSTIVQLTLHSVVGRRRALVLLVLPGLLLALSAFARLISGTDPELVLVVVHVLGMGTLMPLLGLIAGTSVIAPEIEDRSITYLLAKPVSRASIFISKLVVAIGLAVLLGAVPIALATVIVTGSFGVVVLAHGIGAVAAAAAYSALFCMLPIITRNAVFIGLAYALVWETLVGQLISGAKALSVQQWSLAVVEWIADDAGPRYHVDAAVDPGTAVPLLVVLTVACTLYGIRRLGSLRLASSVD